ncbi:MAG: RES family NAD+ phosphorylase [Bacteroidales bacterium]|nr:RES family NAD+ phosphorylase [Bacteroidales bacterium]
MRDARSNPRFIRYLYVAESPTTAVYEVRPILYNAVNVAGIEVKEPLRIANIAVDIDPNPEKEKSVDEWLLGFVQSAFSSPTNNPDDYIPSQIIAEYFRHLGYDGIRYSSSLHEGGYNLTIYDVSKCEPVFSTDMRFEKMKISLRPAIGAENVDGRFQWIKDNVPMRWDRDTMKLVETGV